MTDDPTVGDIVNTMTKKEKKAIFDIVSEISNKRSESGKAIVSVITISKMSEEKQKVAYFLLGTFLHATKNVEEITEELKELLKL